MPALLSFCVQKKAGVTADGAGEGRKYLHLNNT